jgi:hypothetical protein
MNFADYALGKQDHKPDPLTLKMARYFLPDVIAPARYDFDTGKVKFPLRMWQNNKWGDCVVAGEANQLLRLERIEQRRTIKITDQEVIKRYQGFTGAQNPGDENDIGVVVLNAMSDWKHNGFHTHAHNFKISAYGELDASSGAQLRRGIYILHGIHMGLALPLAAQTMGYVWDYNGQKGSDWQPNSWGGHLVYCKAYTPTHIKALTWGSEIQISDSFIDRYCDEAWAVVDSLDAWRSKQTIDVEDLTRHLESIAKRVNPTPTQP